MPQPATNKEEKLPRMACGTCTYYKKATQRTGDCLMHTLTVIDTNTAKLRRTHFRVRKTDVCKSCKLKAEE